MLTADLEALAAAHGTPLYIYDEDAIRARCREYLAAFGAGHVAFAAKSFLCTAMARLVQEEGLQIDCASGGELHVEVDLGGTMLSVRLASHGTSLPRAGDRVTPVFLPGSVRILADEPAAASEG